MKLLYVLLSLTASALAQSVNIAIPTPGQTLQAGSNITVAVVRPSTLTGSTEVGIGITLHHCAQDPCESAVDRLGSILYAGPYQWQLLNDGVEFNEPHENFTVQIPVGFQTGPAVLSVPHASIVGVCSVNSLSSFLPSTQPCVYLLG